MAVSRVIGYVNAHYSTNRLWALEVTTDTETENMVRDALAHPNSSRILRGIDCLIEGLLESPERDPMVVMKIIRRHISELTDFLLQFTGYNPVEKMVKLLSIEKVLQEIVFVTPLKEHVQELLRKRYEEMRIPYFVEINISCACSLTMKEYGVNPKIEELPENKITDIRRHLINMQNAYTAFEKLENLIKGFKVIFQWVTDVIDIRDLLGMFAYAVVKSNLLTLGLDVDYMYGLLHPTLLSGEWGFHFSNLFYVMSALNRATPSYIARGGCILDAAEYDAENDDSDDYPSDYS